MSLPNEKHLDPISVLRGLRPALLKRGIAHAALFGSIARGDANARSDIDVVLTPMAGARLDLIDLGAIQSLLEDALPGRDIDLMVEPVGNAGLAERINHDRAVAF